MLLELVLAFWAMSAQKLCLDNGSAWLIISLALMETCSNGYSHTEYHS